MTPEQLAESLEALADGPPWDTAWLRSLLPELAVRGRLVAQEAGDEEQEIGCSESSMPTSWRVARFEECARVASCLVDPADHAEAVHVAPDTIEPGTGRLLACRTILEDKVTSAKHKFFEGQILYSKIRPALSKCVIAPFDGLCSADMYPIETTQVVRYLQLAMLSKDFVSMASAMANRVKMPKINKVELGSIPIPLPPLAEQHRIVAKVDELMGHAAVVEERHLAATSARVRFRDAALHALAEAEDHEAVETAWSRIEDHFDDLFTEPEDIQPLRQTILQLAVRGRLVAQEAGDGTAMELMSRIEREGHARLEGRVGKMVAGLSVVGDEEAPFQLPAGWCWDRLGRIAEPKAGFAFKSKDFNLVGDGLPLVRIRDVAEGVSETYYSGEYRDEFLVEDGDLLVGMDGKFCVAFWRGGKALLNQRVTRLDWYTDYIQPKFVHWAFGQRLAELQGVKAYTTVDHLSGKQIASSVIPVPPLAEQHRIVAKVDELMALCDTLETTLKRAKTTREQFASSISHALTGPTAASA